MLELIHPEPGTHGAEVELQPLSHATPSQPGARHFPVSGLQTVGNSQLTPSHRSSDATAPGPQTRISMTSAIAALAASFCRVFAVMIEPLLCDGKVAILSSQHRGTLSFHYSTGNHDRHHAEMILIREENKPPPEFTGAAGELQAHTQRSAFTGPKVEG